MVKPLAETEKQEILNAVVQSGSVSGAAKLLEIDRRTIYRKMRHYGLKMRINQILLEIRKQQSLQL